MVASSFNNMVTNFLRVKFAQFLECFHYQLCSEKVFNKLLTLVSYWQHCMSLNLFWKKLMHDMSKCATGFFPVWNSKIGFVNYQYFSATKVARISHILVLSGLPNIPQPNFVPDETRLRTDWKILCEHKNIFKSTLQNWTSLTISGTYEKLCWCVITSTWVLTYREVEK